MTLLRKYFPAVISIFVGGIGGFLYWKFVGCQSGTCSIGSNPFISSAYGAALGYFVSGLLSHRKPV